jgi:hypothetical protein
MKSPDSPPAHLGTWTSLWVTALLSLLTHLWLCQFFSWGERVPMSLDLNPSNLWKYAYHFPPTGSFQVLNWLGVAFLPQPLNLFSLAAQLPPWWFFTTFAPVVATLALLAMAAFLRELGLSRPAALFGGVVYAWQGDIVPFVYPGHYPYMSEWCLFALAAWAALRVERTGHWAYALISGASCGIMVGLLTNTDRGAIASLLIAALYLAPVVLRPRAQRSFTDYLVQLRPLALCTATAFLIALAPILALFQSNIVGVKMAGATNREETYKFVTQFSLGPAETLTYLVPGFFGWHSNHANGPYWGWIGEWPGWSSAHPNESTRNLNLAISTTGTVATVLAVLGAALLFGRGRSVGGISGRPRFYGRVLLALGALGLLLSWGWHTPLYRPLFALPLMDKWRNPLKWLEMTNFALVVLSAIGVQYLLASLNPAAPDTATARRRLGWFTNGILVLLGIGWLASYPLAAILGLRLQAEGFEPAAIANISHTMHDSLLCALVVMALFCLLLRLLWRPDALRAWKLENPWLHRLWQQLVRPDHLPLTLALGLAALSIAQLGWVATQFILPSPLAMLTATNPLLEALRTEGDTVRVSVYAEDPLLNTLLQNQFAADGISCLQISAASRIPDDLQAFLNAFDDHQTRLWFLAGVKNVVVPQEFVAQMQQDPAMIATVDHANGYTLEQTASPKVPSHAIVTMKDYLAKATLVPNAEFFARDAPMLKRLDDPAWDPRASVLLDQAGTLLGIFTGAVPSPSNHVELKTYTPTEIDVDVESVKGGFVLINDQYDPDWEVRLNGRDAPLLRADYIMRAVQVPPGASTIKMHYAAHYRVAGLDLPAEAVNTFSDGTMLAAWLVAGFALRRGTRRATKL